MQDIYNEGNNSFQFYGVVGRVFYSAVWQVLGIQETSAVSVSGLGTWAAVRVTDRRPPNQRTERAGLHPVPQGHMGRIFYRGASCLDNKPQRGSS